MDDDFMVVVAKARMEHPELSDGIDEFTNLITKAGVPPSKMVNVAFERAIQKAAQSSSPSKTFHDMIDHLEPVLTKINNKSENKAPASSSLLKKIIIILAAVVGYWFVFHFKAFR